MRHGILITYEKTAIVAGIKSFESLPPTNELCNRFMYCMVKLNFLFHLVSYIIY